MTLAALHSIAITAGRPFPSWTLVHYLDQTESSYRKLAIIRRILELVSVGYVDSQFKVATTSADLYPTSALRSERFSDFEFFVGKDEDAFAFWERIRKLYRPAVFFERRGVFVPIYDPFGPEALRIPKLVHESPFQINLTGLAELVREFRLAIAAGYREIRHGEELAQRQRDLHQVELDQAKFALEEKRVAVATQKVDLVDKAVSLAERLEASPLSPPMRDFVREQVNGILENQKHQSKAIEAKVADRGSRGEVELLD